MIRYLTITLTLLLGSQIAVAQDTALALLTDKLEKIDSLSATFVQFSLDQKGTRIQESKGEMRASRDGRLYWHTFEPLEQIVSSDGKLVTVYDPDLEQATIQSVNDNLSTTPAILFSGDIENIDKHFYVSHSIVEELDQFSLMPKTQDGLFEKLRVRFLKNTVTELTIIDALGQKSTMSFVQAQINPKLTEDDFKISLPEGTDIIEDLPVSR